MGGIKAFIAAAAIILGAFAAQAGGHVQAGAFTGASNHVTKGTVELVKTDAGYEIRLGEDFWFDGAPDPRVGFGSDGKFVKLTDFEPLKSNSGAQVYKVPAELNVADFDTIYIWCRKFSVPLGLAPLTGATSG